MPPSLALVGGLAVLGAFAAELRLAEPVVPWHTHRGSLAALGRLPGRRIYIHINNTNPILIDGSPERLKVEAAGVEVAEDGMEIEL